MERIRKIWYGDEDQAYEQLASSITEGDRRSASVTRRHHATEQLDRPFSSIEYGIFLLIGVSMLWAWNMFLAAGPYFQRRFQSSDWITENFQAAEISVSTITNLAVMLVLTHMQKGASHPRRIMISLFINMVAFALLALSTKLFLGVSTGVYFGFILVMIFLASMAAGFCQSGVFALVTGFGQPSYIQGIMTGQAVAGVLPSIVQMGSVLSVQDELRDGGDGSVVQVSSTAAFIYFATATGIMVATFVAFSYLLARHYSPDGDHLPLSTSSEAEAEDEEDPVHLTTTTTSSKQTPILTLLYKLRWLAAAVATTFAITMFFPVYTQRIVSVRPVDADLPALLQPPVFIPLAFLFWNTGDLIGRLLTAIPKLSLFHRPRLLFVLALARVVFLGLYGLCNVRGRGAVVPSDFFYLVIVQMGFGVSNGFLGSMCMIGSGEWVDEGEREAAGLVMSLCLVGGLSVGSLLSFVAGA